MVYHSLMLFSEHHSQPYRYIPLFLYARGTATICGIDFWVTSTVGDVLSSILSLKRCRDATQRLLVSRRRPTAPQSEGEEPDWHWLASLLGNEDGLSPITTVDGRNTLEVEDLEYFPGRASVAGSVTGNVFSMVTATSEYHA